MYQRELAFTHSNWLYLELLSFVHSLPRPATVNGSVAVVRSRPTLHPEFLYHFVTGDTFQALIQLKKAGLGVPHLFQADLREFPVNLPPLPEQRKIASILTTVDSLIEQTEALIEKYRRVKQGMMADLLSRGVDSDGKLRPTQQQAPELYKQSELGWIPKEWEVERLGDIAQFKQGIQVPLEAQYDQMQPGLTRFLRIVDYTQHSEEPRYVKTYGNSAEVKKDDIVIVRYGATAGFVGRGPIGAIANNLFRVIPFEEKITVKYLYQYLHSDYAKQFLIICGGASAMPAISFSGIRSLLVAIPSAAEQHQFVNCLAVINQRLTSEKAANTKLRTLKTGLMQDLLTGKVRVKIDENKEIMTHAG